MTLEQRMRSKKLVQLSEAIRANSKELNAEIRLLMRQNSVRPDRMLTDEATPARVDAMQRWTND